MRLGGRRCGRGSPSRRSRPTVSAAALDLAVLARPRPRRGTPGRTRRVQALRAVGRDDALLLEDLGVATRSRSECASKTRARVRSSSASTSSSALLERPVLELVVPRRHIEAPPGELGGGRRSMRSASFGACSRRTAPPCARGIDRAPDTRPLEASVLAKPQVPPRARARRRRCARRCWAVVDAALLDREGPGALLVIPQLDEPRAGAREGVGEDVGRVLLVGLGLHAQSLARPNGRYTLLPEPGHFLWGGVRPITTLQWGPKTYGRSR